MIPILCFQLAAIILLSPLSFLFIISLICLNPLKQEEFKSSEKLPSLKMYIRTFRWTMFNVSSLRSPVDTVTSKYEVVQNLHFANFLFEYHGYLKRAGVIKSINAIHHSKRFQINYKTTWCMFSFDFAFNSYRRVHMEFTNGEISAISKLSVVERLSAGRTCHDITSVLEAVSCHSDLLENRFGASKPVKIASCIGQPVEDLWRKIPNKSWIAMS